MSTYTLLRTAFCILSRFRIFPLLSFQQDYLGRFFSVYRIWLCINTLDFWFSSVSDSKLNQYGVILSFQYKKSLLVLSFSHLVISERDVHMLVFALTLLT